MDSDPSKPLFTPEDMARLPRRMFAVPNHDGTRVLYLEKGGIGKQDVTYKKWKAMDVATGKSRDIGVRYTVYEATWLADDPNTLIALRRSKVPHLGTEVLIYDVNDLDLPRRVIEIKTKVYDLKVKRLKDGNIAFAVSGPAGVNNELHVKDFSGHSGRVYDTDEVRWESKYIDPEKNAIFYSLLSDSGFIYRSDLLHNALAGTGLELKEYDISEEGFVFTARDLSVQPLASRVRHAYYLRLDSFQHDSVHVPRRIEIPDESPEDALEDSLCPCFNFDGSQVAFLRANRIHTFKIGAHGTSKVLEFSKDGDLPLLPQDIRFSPDGKAIYFTGESRGRVNLYQIDLQSSSGPKLLFQGGYVKDFYPLNRNDGKIFVGSSSLTDGSLFSIVDTNGNHEPRVLSSLTNHGATLGISSSQVSEIYFKGAGNHEIHAWMVKPSHFDENRKYPLVLCVHGGPNSAWIDRWRRTDNFALFAEQGYIVIAPNISGSTGFGPNHEKASRYDWGGRPYEDLVKCMDYLEGNPNIDVDNAVMLGASYGGYMVNWAQGHPLGRRFKAMVSSYGVFHLPTFFMETDAASVNDNFGGAKARLENREALERFNPARADLLPNWKTPMLIVHGDIDYRCPVTGALAAFHTLQVLGTPSRLLIFTDEGHGVIRAINILKLLEETFAWINKYTGIAK
ncbi:alpha/beta-hydrolase [Daldinia sp. FL1419]|nr:alpha/beta-hydrolase [Daldinia sp. FL1419]